MTAVACLRVAIDADRVGLSPVSLGPLVSKFGGAYLDSRWLWPRHFEPLTHYAFLLTDPRAERTDVRELARMGDELQAKLFGAGSDGEVALLMFEGSPDAARAFAALSHEALAEALKNPDLLPTGGRLTRVVAPGAEGKEPELLHPRGDRGGQRCPLAVIEAKPAALLDEIPDSRERS